MTEFPLTLRQLRKVFPETTEQFTMGLVNKCVQILLSGDTPASMPTDEEIAAACAAMTQNGQRSPALYLVTVPSYLSGLAAMKPAPKETRLLTWDRSTGSWVPLPEIISAPPHNPEHNVYTRKRTAYGIPIHFYACSECHWRGVPYHQRLPLPPMGV